MKKIRGNQRTRGRTGADLVAAIHPTIVKNVYRFLSADDRNRLLLFFKDCDKAVRKHITSPERFIDGSSIVLRNYVYVQTTGRFGVVIDAGREVVKDDALRRLARRNGLGNATYFILADKERIDRQRTGAVLQLAKRGFANFHVLRGNLKAIFAFCGLNLTYRYRPAVPTSE